jgi:hypothetical protein
MGEYRRIANWSCLFYWQDNLGTEDEGANGDERGLYCASSS